MRDFADKGVLRVLRSLHKPENENGFVHAFRHDSWDLAGIVLDSAAVTCDPEPGGIGRLLGSDSAPGGCSAAKRAIVADGTPVLFVDPRMGAGRDGLWVLILLDHARDRGPRLPGCWPVVDKGTIFLKPVVSGGWLAAIQGTVLHSLLHASEDRY